jgi:hypothetical protein
MKQIHKRASARRRSSRKERQKGGREKQSSVVEMKFAGNAAEIFVGGES